jgi:hypothetical protein
MHFCLDFYHNFRKTHVKLSRGQIQENSHKTSKKLKESNFFLIILKFGSPTNIVALFEGSDIPEEVFFLLPPWPPKKNCHQKTPVFWHFLTQKSV